MRDPEITFTIDKQTCSIYPTSFLQDDIGLFYETDSVPLSRVRDLKDFMSQWLTNIKHQGFEPEKASLYKEDCEDEEEFER